MRFIVSSFPSSRALPGDSLSNLQPDCFLPTVDVHAVNLTVIAALHGATEKRARSRAVERLANAEVDSLRPIIRYSPFPLLGTNRLSTFVRGLLDRPAILLAIEQFNGLENFVSGYAW